MISCTEFIPAYSEGFKFLEQRGGPAEPGRFWSWLSSFYLRDSLDRLIARDGLEGCFTYWSHSLNEEAAGFRMKLDEIRGEFTIELTRCPSRAMLNEMKHIEPYHSYCSHCAALYRPVAEKHGLKYEEDISGCGQACCSLKISYNQNQI